MIRKPANYEEAVAYIAKIPMFVEGRTREHTVEFLERLGRPAFDRRVVHVAGTNGKGSVCAYIQAILAAEGKKTGFFTSPHLISVNERIQIGREMIGNAEFYRAFAKVYDVTSQMEQEGIPGPYFTEFMLGMALLAFEQAEVEYIILETGLGGERDATNVFPSPTLSVITSISLDHTAILGDTVEEIARTKAGIIKDGIPVYFDGTCDAAGEVIIRAAEKHHAPWQKISKNAFEIREVNRKYIAFSRTNAYDKDVIWRVPICGIYQVLNAEIAIRAAAYLLHPADEATGNGPRKSTDPIAENPMAEDPQYEWAQPSRERELRWRDAIEAVQWKGRMEQCADHLIVDGAHNPGAIEAFADTVNALNDSIPPVILFSAVSDKKYDQMIEYLCSHIEAKSYVVTEIPGERRVSAERLGEIFRACTDKPVYICEEIRDALEKARKERPADGYIYCLGSLYLVGNIEKYLKE